MGNLQEIIKLESYNIVVVECGGLGYEVKTTPNSLKNFVDIGDKIFLNTYLYVREDNLDLFGFADKSELSCFKLLISVSGVGPKVALSILSSLDYLSFARCVSSGEYKNLTDVKGIGAKIAQRIVLELKDKILKVEFLSSGNEEMKLSNDIHFNPNLEYAKDALISLGYSSLEITKVLDSIQKDLSVEDIIKSSLKLLSK